MNAGNRVKEARKAIGLSQSAFGLRIGASRDAINNVENDRAEISDLMLIAICREFHVNETWLRTGAGEMFAPQTRGEELAEYVASILTDRPDSFRSALVTAMLRYDPNGPEWEVLERIFNDVSDGYKKETGNG